jgi:hypothetical protein
MARELRQLTVSFTVNKPEHLPLKDGQQMYADDVYTEVSDVVSAALDAWCRVRGHDLLTGEPLL